MKTLNEVRPVDAARVIQVIHVTALKGEGVKDSPIRSIEQYWSLDGRLLAETDAWGETQADIAPGIS